MQVTASLLKRWPAEEGLTWLDALAVIFLALPNGIFLLGWLPRLLAVPGCALLVAALVVLLRSVRHRPGEVGGRILVLIAVATGLWLAFSGIGHLVYSNTDWMTRDAVLCDLVRMRWPVTYPGLAGGPAMLLRAPIGYFLVPACLGAVSSFQVAEMAMLVWTGLGVALALALMLRGVTDRRSAWIRVLVFVLFSGMDVLGFLGQGRSLDLGLHLEWWAVLFQYSSHTTMLFWVPNHALPGWIALAWLLSRRPLGATIPLAVVMVALVPLWSPLTALGLAPLFAAELLLVRGGWPELKRRLLKAAHPAVLVVVLLLGLLVYPYLVVASGTVASGWTGARTSIWDIYLLFVVLEFAVLWGLLIWRVERTPALWTAGLVLFLLPFYHFGPGSDLTMRASIPALAMLAMLLGRWLAEQTRQPWQRIDWRVLLAGILLAIGAVTPMQEVLRAVILPVWEVNTRWTVMTLGEGKPSHYLAPADNSWSRRMDRFRGRR